MPEAKRSPKWGAVRRAFLKAHPVCELCGNTIRLNVHHVEPFHLSPDKELDATNLITLCEGSQVPDLFGLNCHLWAGHLGYWEAVNPRVRKTVEKLGPIVKDGI